METPTNLTYYQKIARLYDLMYIAETGYDHQAQVAWVDAWREKMGLLKVMLDLACGTGKHLACFEALGYDCQGIDGSRAMLALAAQQASRTPLSQGLFETFQLEQSVPLITSFFNAMAYNKNQAELRATCQNVYANLTPNGLFIFDIVCSDSSEPVFSVKTYAGEGLQFSRTFSGLPTPDGFKSTMVFVVFDGQQTEIIEETTLRGMFTEAEILDALQEVGFCVLYSGEGYTTIPVFVAQKPTSD